MGLFSGQGVQPSLKGNATNQITLPAGGVYDVPTGEGGWYMYKLGLYTTFQSFDPIAQVWRNVGSSGDGASMQYVYMDGTTNYRFANQTGCAVGALITNAGSGYVSPPTVVASAGGSIWRAIVGGAVNTTVQISNPGQAYTYPPTVLFSAPPAGGIQATGHATLSAGGVASVVVDNQGAGYTLPPTIQLIPDPREGVNGVSQGYNASAVCTLTGAGTITGLLCIDHGTPLTAVPTLSFSGGGGASAAATTIMCFTLTSLTLAGGTGYTPATGFIKATGIDSFPATASAYVNPATQSQLVTVREASFKVATSAGVPATSTTLIQDGGIYTSVPTMLFVTQGVATAVPTTITPAVGGAIDTSMFTPV